MPPLPQTHTRCVERAGQKRGRGGVGRNAALANSGRDAAIGSATCLTERNGQQAGAQQHEAGGRQRKKSVGDDVVVAHETYHIRCSSEFIRPFPNPDRNDRAISL